MTAAGICTRCDGNGRTSDRGPRCYVCGGSGEVEDTPPMTAPEHGPEGATAGWEPCDCIDKINARLGEHNSRLCLSFPFRSDGGLAPHRVQLRTEKVETRKRDSMGAIASFCPFCGNSYEARASDPRVQP